VDGQPERDTDGALDEKDQSSLAPRGLYILPVVGLLLVVRETFLLVTNNKVTQYKEHLFYPFAAGPELAAILLFLTPGLVPLKCEVAEASRADSHVSGLFSFWLITLTDRHGER
jgi:hypothetical protein